jgi:hypothetical protein
MCQAMTKVGKPCRLKAEPFCHAHTPSEPLADAPAPFDRVAELRKNLRHLDEAVQRAEPKELAALLRERRITLSELASLGGVEKGSSIDELARRREDRRAKTGMA